MSSSSAHLSQNSCSSRAFGSISTCLMFVPTSAYPSFETAVSTQSTLFQEPQTAMLRRAWVIMGHESGRRWFYNYRITRKYAVNLKLFTAVFKGFSMVAVSLVPLTCFSPLNSRSRKFCAHRSRFVAELANNAQLCTTWYVSALIGDTSEGGFIGSAASKGSPFKVKFDVWNMTRDRTALTTREVEEK